MLGEQDGVQLQVSVGMPDESGRRTVGIYARVESPSDDAMYPGQMWVRHASGVLARAQATSEDRPVVDGRAAALADVSWPPEGSEAVPADDLYDRLAGLGLDYGPAFLGIRAVWRRGREVFLELSLSGREQAQASQFGLHPALLDAGLQGIAASLTNGSADVGEAIALRLPFSFSGVELHARGASALRVHLLPVGADGMSLVGADESGTLVVSMQSLTLREVPAGVLAGVGGADHDSLFCVNWVPIAVSVAPPISAGGWVLLDAGEQGGESPDAGLGTERGGLVEATATFAGTDSATTALAPASTASSTRRTLVDTPLVEALRVAGVLDGALVCADLLALGEAVDNGARVPEIVLVDLSADLGDAGLPEVAHEAVNHALGLVQSWLSDERFSTSRLVFVTRGAVAVQTGEQLPGLALAPVWGLVRSAQSENPDRLLLIDLDAHEASPRTLLAVLAATGMDEPQLAIRQGEVLAARLGRIARVPPPHRNDLSPEQDAPLFDPQGTVLITGATGALGALMTRHLVAEHGIRNVLLASRQGLEAPGAPELEAELTSLGAHVRIAACDVSYRAQLKTLIESVPEKHPLRGVVHAAGTLDDGVVESLTNERLDRVLAPKLDAAWHLHQLTERLELSMFVLFSSAAATFGSPGQGNYAAANAFLDTLAQHRTAKGLAATSLAWGQWATPNSMTGHLSDTDLARLARSGIAPLTPQQGLKLYDTATTIDQALIIPMHLDMS